MHHAVKIGIEIAKVELLLTKIQIKVVLLRLNIKLITLMKKKSDGAEVLLSSIVKGIFEKKGQNVLKIDLRKLENRITDYFVICHASSTTQVSAICDSVEDTVRKSW